MARLIGSLSRRRTAPFLFLLLVGVLSVIELRRVGRVWSALDQSRIDAARTRVATLATTRVKTAVKTQCPSPTSAQRNTVHFLTPVSNRYNNLLGLLKSLARSDDKNYIVHVVDFLSADGESWRDRLLASGANIDYVIIRGVFSKTLGLTVALSRVTDERAVCCVMDADMRLPRSFVKFARDSVIPAKRAVLLSVANLHADGTYADRSGLLIRPSDSGVAAFTPEFLPPERARRNGGAGLMIFAKRDAQAAGGMAIGRFVNKTTWGDEDSDFSGRMQNTVLVVPVHWRDVVHVYHERRCSEWYRGMYGDKICKPSRLTSRKLSWTKS